MGTARADCAVPLHPLDRYLRGFSQTDWLCRALSAELSIPWEKKALRKIRPDEKAACALPKGAAKQSCGRVLRAQCSRISGKRILLVDDVFTTGSTLKEAALALKRAGAGAVFALTAAKTRFTGRDGL